MSDENITGGLDLLGDWLNAKGYTEEAGLCTRAMDEINRLRDEIDALCIVNARLTKEAMSDYHEGWEEGCAAMKEENARLHQAMHDIYEVYAGSEGFKPETCAEAYLQERILEMAYIATKHKRVGGGND